MVVSRVLCALGGFFVHVTAQVRYATGQDVVPVFEGWERNADGSFNMVFGYMNRNYEEEVDVPVGPDDTALEPGDVNQGQPSLTFMHAAAIRLLGSSPEGLGQEEYGLDVVTSHGKTEKAYTSLMPVWEIDAGTYQADRGGPGELGEPDNPPSIKVEGAPQRTIARRRRPHARCVQPLVTDDGRPSVRPSQSGSNARVEGPLMQAMVRLNRGVRLGVIWVVYRGDARAVTFEPRKVPVADGKAPRPSDSARRAPTSSRRPAAARASTCWSRMSPSP